MCGNLSRASTSSTLPHLDRDHSIIIFSLHTTPEQYCTRTYHIIYTNYHVYLLYKRIPACFEYYIIHKKTLLDVEPFYGKTYGNILMFWIY